MKTDNLDFIEQSPPTLRRRLPTYEEYLANPGMTPWTVELGNLTAHYRQRAANEKGDRR